MSRLLNAVQQQLTSLPLAATSHCWTDSFTTLCWIKNECQWKTYVQRRVEKIRSLTDKDLWRFCPGVENPADIPSRSCTAADLVHNDLWWNGPSFLKAQIYQWPDLPTTYDREIAYEEFVKKRRVVTHALTVVDGTGAGIINLKKVIVLERFGSRLRLLRVTALVIKFTKILIQKVRDQGIPEPKGLSARDLKSAEEPWVKSIQQQAFPSEYHELLLNKKVFLKQLHLFIDDRGVIHCRGRLGRTAIPSCSNNPILLPPKHWLSTLLIRDHHQCVLHDGIRETVNSVRRTYWIIRGREVEKRVIRKCVTCLKGEEQPYPAPVPLDLPEECVSDGPPYFNTDIDFAGPLYVKDSKATNGQSKVYICLFTCASTRAVHLELTADLTSNAFL